MQGLGKRKEEIGKSKKRAVGYSPITHFTDIEAWKLSRELRIAVYRIIKKLPIEEKYDLASQMRRAAVSCTANIAEGYGRFHFQENIQFCRVSRGSMYEIQDHLMTCLDNEYIAKEEHETVWDLSVNAIRVLDGYIRYLKKQQKGNLTKTSE
jgi:four helix bundle protein